MLTIATLASFSVAEFWGDPVWGVAMILCLAALKVRLILHRFMALEFGPRGWRLAFDVWTIGCATVIAGLCYFGKIRT